MEGGAVRGGTSVTASPEINETGMWNEAKQREHEHVIAHDTDAQKARGEPGHKDGEVVSKDHERLVDMNNHEANSPHSGPESSSNAPERYGETNQQSLNNQE
jgi:hypothetical protein